MTAQRPMLPAEFSDLEPFAEAWALPRASERYRRRLASSMEEMQVFYSAAMPRGERAIAYLERFELDALPDTARHLMWLLCSLSVVSPSVEVFKQPKIPDSGATYLEWIDEPEL